MDLLRLMEIQRLMVKLMEILTEIRKPMEKLMD